MQTHHDADQERRFMDRLKAKAEAMTESGQSQITGGKPGEKTLAEWFANGVDVRQLPDDELGILRISVGGGDKLPVNANYLVFRGDRSLCIDLLRKALVALETDPK